MGCSGSRPEKNEALLLCKERMRFIKQAIDSRYALSAAHLAYIQSLRSIGIALRQFAEAEILIESSLSTSDQDKSPSHSSFASPSPSHIVETVVDSSLHGGSPFSPRLSNTSSFMRANSSASVTVRIDSSSNHIIEEESLSFPLPPPPPPPPETDFSWDFFSPVGSIDIVRSQNGERDHRTDFGNSLSFRPFREQEVVPSIEEEVNWEKVDSKGNNEVSGCSVPQDKINGRPVLANTNPFSSISPERLSNVVSGQSNEERVLNSDCNHVNRSTEVLADLCSKEREKTELEKELCSEREDASEFITHRAKDFLSSMKDIEHRFHRAAESGNEVSRLLEANKIGLHTCSETLGRSHASGFLSVLHFACCKGDTIPCQEPSQHMTNVITWNRSTSSMSSSSKNPLASASKDDVADSGSDFVEDFCMISGSHSSTLDRLHAWERKLYDEVKASESISKEYDRKCSQLRQQFARDLNARVIDKTRAVVKDLHSRVRVAIQAVDSISKRIEKLRDEELQPQLVELIQGLIRMWKAMLECHHAQYITISLAYHVKSSTTAPRSETYKQVLVRLRNEIDFFGSSFASWVNAHGAYVQALNAWLQNCILLPRERPRGRKITFSPRRALAPPIFVLIRDWLAGNKLFPSEELSDAIKSVVSELNDSFEQQVDEKLMEPVTEELENRLQNKDNESSEKDSNLDSLQASLTQMFDRLTKFAEASIKTCEDIKQGSDAAHVAYTNGRTRLVT